MAAGRCQLSSTLGEASYRVEAEQTETLTGETEYAGPVDFTVDTQKPSVTLNGIPSPTNDSTPSFSGTASDPSEAVTVYVFRGTSAGGTLAAKVSANPSGGAWSSGSVSPLADGTYTAIAEQPSSIGNEAGRSESTTFEVHASKPKVSLNGISSPTADRTPSFTGSASEGSTVTVHIYEGGSASGSPVAEAQASGTSGSWSSGAASPGLPDGSYTAVAEQESEFGNGPGRSGEIHFRIETPPPAVTLEGIAPASNDTTPTFSGTASEKDAVFIHIYAGGSAHGEERAEAEAKGTGGSWNSGPAAPGLAEGSYTAVAEQAGSVRQRHRPQRRNPFHGDHLLAPRHAQRDQKPVGQHGAILHGDGQRSRQDRLDPDLRGEQRFGLPGLERLRRRERRRLQLRRRLAGTIGRDLHRRRSAGQLVRQRPGPQQRSHVHGRYQLPGRRPESDREPVQQHLADVHGLGERLHDRRRAHPS